MDLPISKQKIFFCSLAHICEFKFSYRLLICEMGIVLVATISIIG